MIYQVLSGARQLSDKAEYRLEQAERAAGIGTVKQAVVMPEGAPENAYPKKQSTPMILREPSVPAVGTSEGADLQSLEVRLSAALELLHGLVREIEQIRAAMKAAARSSGGAGGRT